MWLNCWGEESQVAWQTSFVLAATVKTRPHSATLCYTVAHCSTLWHCYSPDFRLGPLGIPTAQTWPSCFAFVVLVKPAPPHLHIAMRLIYKYLTLFHCALLQADSGQLYSSAMQGLSSYANNIMGHTMNQYAAQSSLLSTQVLIIITSA